MKVKKAFVLYANSEYLSIVTMAVKSINSVSDIPVIVYMINCHSQVPGATTITLEVDNIDVKKSDYIDRSDSNIYRLLIQRPQIIEHALENYAETVAYIDSDTIVTKHINNIFDYYPKDCTHPYFVQGVYDYLFIDGRGGVETRDEMHLSLEHAACELFGVDQSVRDKYRQTGYFVAGQESRDWINEWSWMCNHPKVITNHRLYAPYHEETIANVLLWKYNIHEGLPLMYINYRQDTNLDELEFTGYINHVSEWVALPAYRNQLMALHGEKDIKKMDNLINKIHKKILFLAPHLSTGGMPQFLLKRIQTLTDFTVYVVEWANYSNEYTVQKDQIKKLTNKFYTLGEDKTKLINIIKDNDIDIVHIDEMAEHLGDDADKVLPLLYSEDRTWKIVETCHNISFNYDNQKIYHPEAYAFCSPHHLDTFSNTNSIVEVIEYPIEEKIFDWQSKLNAKYDLGLDVDKKHVVNVGLWTKGKNQGEGVALAKKFPHVQFHFVGNQAGNFKEYWQPIMEDIPENVKVWGERTDIDKFLLAADVFMFNSVWECNPLVLREAISYKLPILARNLPQYKDMFTKYITDLNPLKMKNQLSQLLKNTSPYSSPTDNTLVDFKKSHTDLYTSVLNSNYTNYKVHQSFIDSPFLEIKGSSKEKFTVIMEDEKGPVYSSQIDANCWIKLNREYYSKWKTIVKIGEEVVYTHELNLEGERVYIAFESSSLGDSIAWIPYVLEFQKKHNCKVIVSTFKNFLFEDVYPELEFVKPGADVPNIYAMYNIGWFYSENKEPELPNTIPLQKAASNILGLEHREIVPRVKSDWGNVCGMKDNYSVPGKYVTIATNSTAGCKFWTREGWQDVINYLHEKGYKVINTSIENNPFDNCEKIVDTSLEYTIDCIRQSKFFIGLSSGLSWLAWAIGTPVVMISNFTEADHEFSCYRVTDESLCHGCWNNPNHKFDKGDWDWCPEHKNTPRHFECHRGISSDKVISKILTLLLISKK